MRESFLEELENGLWHVTDGEDGIEGHWVDCTTWITRRITIQNASRNPSYPAGIFPARPDDGSVSPRICRG